jgi:hypothetical protein
VAESESVPSSDNSLSEDLLVRINFESDFDRDSVKYLDRDLDCDFEIDLERVLVLDLDVVVLASSRLPLEREETHFFMSCSVSEAEVASLS